MAAAAKIIRSLAEDHRATALGGPVQDFMGCGWRANSGDVGIVADYLTTLKGADDITERVNETAKWILGEQEARRIPTTIGAINHLKRTFGR